LLDLRFFTSPYFDHDAFTHHALRVLDTPDSRCLCVGGACGYLCHCCVNWCLICLWCRLWLELQQANSTRDVVVTIR